VGKNLELDGAENQSLAEFLLDLFWSNKNVMDPTNTRMLVKLHIYILIGTSTLHFYITYILLWFLNGWFHLRIRRAGFSVQAPPGCSGKVRRGWTTHRPAQIAQIHWFRL
jgi:hypothetical protein